MNKKVVIGIVVVVVVALVWWLSASKKNVSPTGSTAVKGGMETVYDQQLNGLNEANIGAEMRGIDSDLNQL